MRVLQVRPRRVFDVTLLVGLFFWVMLLGGANAPTARVYAAGKNAAKAKSQITVKDNKALGKLPKNPFGIWLGNTGHDLPQPIYFYRMPQGTAHLADVATKALYYATDLDNWAAPRNLRTAVPILYPEWMPTDEFIALSQQVKADPLIAVNVTVLCQQADPSEPPSPDNVTCAMAKPKMAVDWIKYLKSIQAPVKRVVLGGEPYAGCLYWLKGINCKNVTGMHKVALAQEDYAARVIKWAKKIKKANPDIQVGIHLQPNTFLCKKVAELNPNANDAADLDVSSPAAAQKCGGKSWDETVLEAASQYVDFVVVHQYFVVTGAAADEPTAQKLSYYQEQRNMRVYKNGVSAFPSQIRKELLTWLPAKKNVPIVIAEFNVSYLEKVSVDEMYRARQGLYTGIALGEAYLDLIKPVQTSAGRLNGASTTILLGMFAPQLTLTRMPNLSDPLSTFYLPSWYIVSMLKAIPGKTLVKTKVTNNPTTAVQRPALKVYTVTKGKKEWIVVFNHGTRKTNSDIVFAEAHPVSAKVTQLGKSASGFLAMNDAANPTAMTPQTSVVPPSKLGSDRIQNFVFPPHSLTVLEVQIQ